ncbi:hypothetical protein DRE_00333 [Drechslerella stenobrocha 248]|uniref:Anaphase-promoting complex subunit cut9 n=1 Tax=Drechslerella stenobrocha 248 TaxID=1043628 RepID=W7IEB8_9PEZI|nr:hypothetical protein DRE_00333 [Drechslerella stenobrocha 248]
MAADSFSSKYHVLHSFSVSFNLLRLPSITRITTSRAGKIIPSTPKRPASRQPTPKDYFRPQLPKRSKDQHSENDSDYNVELTPQNSLRNFSESFQIALSAIHTAEPPVPDVPVKQSTLLQPPPRYYTRLQKAKEDEKLDEAPFEYSDGDRGSSKENEEGGGVEKEDDIGEENMEKFLREWRQDAVNKHQYDSAIFIGDKLLALTNDPNDAFFLAQIHFSTGQYTRAQSFLDGTGLIQKSAPCKYLYALSQIKQNKYEDALQTLGDESPVISNPHGLRRRGASRANDEKYEAAMCYLRGVIYSKQGAYDKAKEAYKDAVKIDVKCFEAFDTLMRNNLLSPEEEWQFIEEIDFDTMAASVGGAQGEATAQFLKALYTTRLSKYKNSTKFDEAISMLSTQYPLGENHDIVLAKAELLYTQCRFSDSLKLVKELLARDKYNFKLYPVYIACLFELQEKNELFLMSHDLADNHREEPVTFVAIGAYYMLIDRLPDARRFFSKASVMDPSFGPAWIGFAHTFAAEGEHDQAISAYSAAAKLFQGTHLPQMFLGMQHLQLNNITLADEYLQIAWGLCKTDPLLMNELGVVFYHNDHLHEAVKMFLNGIKLADEIGGDPKTYIQFRTNLGHAYRRLGRYGEAVEEFTNAIRVGGNEANIRCSMGLCCIMEGKTWDAITHLHEALALVPQDPVATELLEQALLKSADEPFQPTYVLPDGRTFAPTDKDIDRILGEDKVQRGGSSTAAATERSHGTVKRKGGHGGSRGTRRGEPDPSVMDVSESEF